MSKASRAAVVAEARLWLGTPYHHRGTIRGVGVDCAMFPQGVYTACGLMAPADFGEYPAAWHVHHDEQRYLDIVLAVAHEIPGDPRPGDFVLWKFARCYAHGGIVTCWPRFIHAHIRHGVVEDDASQNMEIAFMKNGAPRPIRYFSLWEACSA